MMAGSWQGRGRVVAGSCHDPWSWHGPGNAVIVRLAENQAWQSVCHAPLPLKSDFLSWQNCWKFPPAKSNMCVAGLWQVCGIGVAGVWH